MEGCVLDQPIAIRSTVFSFPREHTGTAKLLQALSYRWGALPHGVRNGRQRGLLTLDNPSGISMPSQIEILPDARANLALAFKEQPEKTGQWVIDFNLV